MSSPEKASWINLHPLGYFEKAVCFQSAADVLFETIRSAGNQRPLRDPTYFLYHQAVELALKACLSSRGLDLPKEGRDQHDIEKFFEQCRAAKLLGLNDSNFNMHNLVVMLHKGN